MERSNIKFALSKLTLPIAFLLGFIQLYLKTRGEYISPWDEMYHFSYIQYVYEGHIPRYGDVLNTWSRQGFSCYPVWPFGMTTSIPCGEISTPNFYPEGGTNTAAIWPPIYYALVAILLKLVVPFGYDPMVFARLFTVLIWTSGVYAIAINLQKMGVKKINSFGFVLLLCSLPLATFHGAFITPHSMIPLLTSGFLYLYRPLLNSHNLEFKQRFKIIVFSILTIFTVPHAISLVAIFALTDFCAQGLKLLKFKEIRIQLLEFLSKILQLCLPLLPLVVAFLGTKFWTKLQDLRTVSWQDEVSTAAQQVAADPPLTAAQYLEAIWRFFPHTVDAFQFQGTLSTAISQVWMFFFITGVGAIILSNERVNRILFSIMTIIVGIAFSIYLEVTIAVAIAPRYGLSIVFAGFVMAMLSIKNRAASYIFLFATVATYLATLSSIPFKS